MKERPIIFNTEMVKAILDGRKTQTRRLVKVKAYADSWDVVDGVVKAMDCYGDHNEVACPYGKVGDRLWVRETFWMDAMETKKGDWIGYCDTSKDEKTDCKCFPSIHMPRWASRITLEITGVRVERVQDISEKDAKKEGVLPESPRCFQNPYRVSFMNLWQSIYGKTEYSWDNNPWVWVIEFKMINTEEGLTNNRGE